MRKPFRVKVNSMYLNGAGAHYDCYSIEGDRWVLSFTDTLGYDINGEIPFEQDQWIYVHIVKGNEVRQITQAEWRSFVLDKILK